MEVQISWREGVEMWTMSQERLDPPDPRLSSPEERERNAAMARRVGVYMLQFYSVSNSPLTDNTFRNPFEPFQIKWEVYFSKELFPLVFIVLNMFLHASAYEYVTPQMVHIFSKSSSRGCPRGVLVKAMDCGIVVREFVLQSRYYVHFRANTLGKGMNPFILPAMG